MEKNPTVFISYSHDSQNHLDRVIELSNKLRGEGIDCILDQYEESPQEGWPRWADRNISNADYVLVICTQTFYNRVMGIEVDGVGHGVIWEGNIIYQHLYNGGTLNKKYIPILFDAKDKKFIPTPIGGASFYILQNDYDKLYWRLRGETKTTKPELGALRKLPKKERKTMFISSIVDSETWDKAGWNGVGYIEDLEQEMPPTIALLYKSEEFGRKIFEDLIEQLGAKDDFDELRIAIIEGDDEDEPFGYYVHIGGYIENIHKRLKKQLPKENFELFMMVSRIHRMTPLRSSDNLKRFKDKYNKYKYFYIIPGTIDDMYNIKVNTELNIFKRKIEFRQVKDITGDKDIDAVVLKKFRKENQ